MVAKFTFFASLYKLVLKALKTPLLHFSVENKKDNRNFPTANLFKDEHWVENGEERSRGDFRL